MVFSVVAYYVARKGTCFLPLSVRCTTVFFSSCTLYGEIVTILAEPVVDDLALLVPCFETKGSGLRREVFTVLPAEADV